MKIYKIREWENVVSVLWYKKINSMNKEIIGKKSNNLTLKLEGRNHRKKYSASINYNVGPKN